MIDRILTNAFWNSLTYLIAVCTIIDDFAQIIATVWVQKLIVIGLGCPRICIYCCRTAASIGVVARPRGRI